MGRYAEWGPVYRTVRGSGMTLQATSTAQSAVVAPGGVYEVESLSGTGFLAFDAAYCTPTSAEVVVQEGAAKAVAVRRTEDRLWYCSDSAATLKMVRVRPAR